MTRPIAILLALLAFTACSNPEDRSHEYVTELAAVYETVQAAKLTMNDCTFVPLYVAADDELASLCDDIHGLAGCYQSGGVAEYVALRDYEDPYGRSQAALHEFTHCVSGHGEHDELFCSIANGAWARLYGERKPALGLDRGCL